MRSKHSKKEAKSAGNSPFRDHKLSSSKSPSSRDVERPRALLELIFFLVAFSIGFAFVLWLCSLFLVSFFLSFLAIFFFNSHHPIPSFPSIPNPVRSPPIDKDGAKHAALFPPKEPAPQAKFLLVCLQAPTPQNQRSSRYVGPKQGDPRGHSDGFQQPATCPRLPITPRFTPPNFLTTHPPLLSQALGLFFLAAHLKYTVPAQQSSSSVLTRSLFLLDFCCARANSNSPPRHSI